MEIEEKVNPGKEKQQFSKIPFGNRKSMQSQIVASDQQTDVFSRVCLPINIDGSYVEPKSRRLHYNILVRHEEASCHERLH